MKAVRCCDKEKRVEVVDIPAPEGEGVRVKVRSAGICGSDLHMVDAGFPITSTLGHEVAGILSDGRAVALEPLSPCGHCDRCQAGDYGMCRLSARMIHGVGLDGGMAEEILVPERSIVPLPDNVSVADACLVEPLAVAAHGVRRLSLGAKTRVAIIGAGPVGLCAAALCVAYAGEVSIAARHDAQKIAAEKLGTRLDPEGEFDVVIDCAGTSDAVAMAARLCRPRGCLLLLATYWEGLLLPADEVSMKNLRIEASYLYSQQGLARDVDVAAQLLGRYPSIAGALISHRLPLDAAAEAFEIAANRRAGAIKVVLEP
jgi:threonine dehydrogenase-like Zn-dependent dehydrogenase